MIKHSPTLFIIIPTPVLNQERVFFYLTFYYLFDKITTLLTDIFINSSYHLTISVSFPKIYPYKRRLGLTYIPRALIRAFFLYKMLK